MAKLTLTLEGVDLKKEINGEYTAVNTISLSTETTGEKIKFKVTDDSYSDLPYNLNLVNCKFQKKMYQPTEILADLQINMASGVTWTEIGRKIIESTFKHKQVKLEADGDSIGDDFYVHEVLPCYKKDSMVVKLKIYSLDKLLTLDKTCYSYVAKKLVSDIIKPKIADYKKPYNEKEELVCSDYGSSSAFDKGVHLQVLRYVTKEEEIVIRTPQVHESGEEVKKIVYTYAEHIFPYLVQYNESFYDMLIRTCNRWGEFVFWEDGRLNIGYDSEAAVKEVGDYNTITYPQQDSNDSLLPSNADQHYFPVGADDGTIRDTNAQKSKWSVKGKIGSLNGMGDLYMMQKFSQFFGTNKDPVTFIVNQVIDDLVDWGIEEAAVSDRNKDYNGKYFPDSGKKDGTTDEQYGQASFMMPDGSMKEKDALNEFTEINTKYKDAKYLEILGYEQKAPNNVVVIDYDTVWPNLKLGNIIKVNDEEFIVTDISSKKNAEGNQVFLVEGIGKVADKFYPAMLPTGHVRYSGPQKATVQEASSGDPCDQNRVRVAFPWQMKDQTTWVGDLSPRIRIASSDGGANMVSRYYKGDSVLIGYVDGNIERPYVLGSIPMMGTLMNNVHTMSTPGGHALNLTDGSGQGFDKFMTSAFTPCVNTVTSFAPASLKMDNLSDWKYNKYFEGGFTLSDRYGIYRIAGSTENRSVSIMSPWGNVMINAFTGIQILAPNGDIKIVGKNVDIAAGNKLTLTSGTNIIGKLRGNNKKDKAFNWLKDLPVAVAEKMSQKLLKVVDLTLVRSVVEIVMRPVEGTLTLKSLRFMKLEAGMRNRAEFPALAYNTEKRKEYTKYFNEQYEAINGSEQVFAAINGFVEKLAMDYDIRSLYMVEAMFQFEQAIRNLKRFANGQPNAEIVVCNTYQDLETDFWEVSPYTRWDESKLGFQDNVDYMPDDHGNYLSKVDSWFYSRIEGFRSSAAEEIRNIRARIICDERYKLRKEVLEKANELRERICEIVNFDMDNEVETYFQTHLPNAAPADYIEKLKAAASKDKIRESAILVYPEATSIRDRGTVISNIEKKYLRRVLIYNLLLEFGFDKDVRRKIKKNLNDESESEIPNPDLTSKATDGQTSLVCDEYWSYFVASLSGMPAMEKKKGGVPGLGQKMLDTLSKSSGASDVFALHKTGKERNIWGEGKEGTILIGADGKNYEFKNNTFNVYRPFDPVHMTFSEDLDGLNDIDKTRLSEFMGTLRRILSQQ